jgi:threonine aldolase
VSSEKRGFASDNAAPVLGEVLAAIAAVNDGHAFAYGHDRYSEAVCARLADALGAAAAFPVLNGTGANVICLRAACRPWEAVICAPTAHLNCDEAGAPEAIAGVKLLTVQAEHGKLCPASVRAALCRPGDEHAVAPRVISITQSTELGTVYEPDEVRALAELAHSSGMLLHVDGARLANAAAALGCSLAAACAGADLISFGATKVGALAAEAVVVRDHALAQPLVHLRKQSLQLASKLRFLAAQLDALLEGELWRRAAAHANAMAARLALRLQGVPGLRITHPVQANAVFAILPPAATRALLERFDFYVWDEHSGEVRWMCSHDTTAEDVEEFAEAVAAACQAAVARKPSCG